MSSPDRKLFQTQSKQYYTLLGVTLLIVAIGLVMVASASAVDALRETNSSYSVFNRQAGFAVIGLIIMLMLSRLNVSHVKSLTVLFLLATLALQTYTVLFGADINGNRNWIYIFGYSLQPSEFLKMAMIMAMALMISRNQDLLEGTRFWFRPLGLWGLVLGLVAIMGRDVGTGVVIVAIGLGMFVMGGMRWRYWLGVVTVSAIAGIFAIMSSASRSARFRAWLFPEDADPLGVRWQYEHGTWALAAGGFFGTGLGRSKLKWSWIPEVENDFIFAIIGEELGLLGASMVILLFVILAINFLVMIRNQRDIFSRLVISGVMFWVILQAFTNIGVVLGALPVLGVPLPLISAGGSSLIATLGAIGVVLALERSRHRSDARTPVRS